MPAPTIRYGMRFGTSIDCLVGKGCDRTFRGYREARPRLGDFLVDDQDVAVRLPLHGLADALAQEPLQQVRLTGSDHDQVGTDLLGGRDDRFRGLTDRGLILGARLSAAQVLPRLDE